MAQPCCLSLTLVNRVCLLTHAVLRCAVLQGVNPAQLGAWVGLDVPSAQLLAWLTNSSTNSSSTAAMLWDDGSEVNRTLLTVCCRAGRAGKQGRLLVHF